MTSRNSLKRQIRVRMRKTGESYTAARQHFRVAMDSRMNTQEFENPRTRIANRLQPNLWPDWVEQHAWLQTFLPRVESETRNRGDPVCDHFHVILAFLRLPSPVPDWFIQLRVNAEQWKEDVLVTLGMNSNTKGLEPFVSHGKRITAARNSTNPIVDVPLDGISHEAERMLDLAKGEAELDNVSVDERHFMVPMMDWHPHGEPTLEELRKLTGRK